MSELSQSELITSEDISEIFKNVIPSIKEQATKQITDKIKSQLSWKFESIISDEVNKFIMEEIVPEVRKQLMTQKDAITAKAVEGINECVAMVGKAMLQVVSNKMSNSSWQREKIIKAFFE